MPSEVWTDDLEEKMEEMEEQIDVLEVRVTKLTELIEDFVRNAEFVLRKYGDK